MLVDVILLRRHGERTHRGDLVSTRPVRGRLFVRSAKSVWHGKPEGIATLTAPDDSMRALLPTLRGVRLVRVQDTSILITGTETIEQGENPRRLETFTYRQTWWCRIVGREGGRPAVVETA